MFAAFTIATLSHAAGSLTPYIAEDIEHNTNVFDVSKGSLVEPIGKNGPTYADTFFDTRAGVDGTYLVDQQKFFGNAEFRHFKYDNFTTLDHNETTFDLGLTWFLNRAIDGQIEYRREQRMVQFRDLGAASTQLIIETDGNATARFNVKVAPEWRWETELRDRVLGSPRVDVPGLSLREDSVREGFKYLGVTNLSAGLEVGYMKGRYDHDPIAIDPTYRQTSVALAAQYQITGLTSFTGDLGYSKRSDPTNSGLSGITGSLGYQHSLSAKTSVSVQLGRALNTYLTTGGNEIDTNAGASLTYQLTYKIGLKAGYSYTSSKFPGAPNGATTLDRVDHFQTANAELTYQVLHWLSIRPYARYQSRSSNQAFYGYNSNIVGIELLARPPRRNP